MMFAFIFEFFCAMILGEKGHHRLHQSFQQFQKENCEKTKGQLKSFLSGLLCFIMRMEGASGMSLTSP